MAGKSLVQSIPLLIFSHREALSQLFKLLKRDILEQGRKLPLQRLARECLQGLSTNMLIERPSDGTHVLDCRRDLVQPLRMAVLIRSQKAGRWVYSMSTGSLSGLYPATHGFPYIVR